MYDIICYMKKFETDKKELFKKLKEITKDYMKYVELALDISEIETKRTVRELKKVIKSVEKLEKEL